MKAHGPLTPLDVALDAVRARCRPLPAVDMPLPAAAGCVLAADVLALTDLPATDVSMMDGYALRAAEGGQALRVSLEVAAGDVPPEGALGAGEAARIFTGAPLPRGADCVVMQEHCAREGGGLRVDPAHPPRQGQHIRRRGEEVRARMSVLPAGTLLGPAEISLAAACQAANVRVHRRPRVALLCTGDELVPLGRAPGPGQIVETNSIALAEVARACGATPIVLGIAPDQVEEIVARLRDADADLLVTTGGASVGDHDHARAALERLGGALVFHSVAIRPGKPILFGTAARERLVFGLPGNPAANLLGFELFVRPAVRRLAGDPAPDPPAVRAVLRGNPLSRVPGLTFFPRGRVGVEEGRLVFVPSGEQSSMQIGSWSRANAVARLPPGEGRVELGAEVEALLLGRL